MRKLHLVLPFILGAVALRLAVAPVGDAIAGAITGLLPTLAALAPLEALEGPGEGEASIDEGEMSGPRRVASRTPPAPRHHAAPARDEGKDGGAPLGDVTSSAPRGTIVIPASVVTRAIEKKDVGATNASAPDGTPLGARLHGVSRYRTGLRDGDVVVSVEGTRTPTVSAMVGVGMRVASGGGSRLAGRILRGDATYAVVIELPR